MKAIQRADDATNSGRVRRNTTNYIKKLREVIYLRRHYIANTQRVNITRSIEVEERSIELRIII